jgi:hypothetical protein
MFVVFISFPFRKPVNDVTIKSLRSLALETNSTLVILLKTRARALSAPVVRAKAQWSSSEGHSHYIMRDI